MKLKYDPRVDVLKIYLTDADIAGSKEIAPGVVADFDKDRRLVSLEIMDAGDRYPLDDLGRFSFEEVPS